MNEETTQLTAEDRARMRIYATDPTAQLSSQARTEILEIMGRALHDVELYEKQLVSSRKK